MKRAAILILFCAIATPGAIAAQTSDPAAEPIQPTRVIGTKWSLKQPKPKPQLRADVAGPRVPPAPKIRVPQTRTAQAPRPKPKQRPNNAALVNAINSGKRPNR